MKVVGGPGNPRRTPLPGSEPLRERGTRDAGAWPREERLEVSVLLRRNLRGPAFPGLEVLGALPVVARRYLSRSEFAQRHGATPDDLERVERFALDTGLSVVRREPARRVVGLSGTAGDLASAFGVDLRRFEAASGAYRGQVGAVQLPPALAEAVAGVFGLDASPRLRPHFRRNADPSAVGYPVPAVGTAYDFPQPWDGSGQTIGLLEFGGGYTADDLSRFFDGLGLTVPTVVAVGVDGAGNAPTGDPNGPDSEVELDIEISGALAPAAKVVVYFAPNTEQGFVDALTTAVHDATHAPSVLSISWGGPEETWSGSARAALETVAQDAALQGVAIFAASGDQGASDGEPMGTRAVDFPASSPYVMGCGGTRLELSGTAILSEVVWNDLATNEGATGGGVSEEFALPSYQTLARVPAAPNGFVGRGVPDVAANADPETGYAVVVDGSGAVIGGTSAVAPLWAALAARLVQALDKPLGYLNPAIYAPAASMTFRSITSGNNGGYSAAPGWNPCAGWGSPQGTRLLAALRAG